MAAEPAPGVRGADLAADDPLRGEWNVIAVGPTFAGALVARDCGDTGPDAARRFDYAITHDRDLVIAAANSLLVRLHPE
jgi:DICT domain-containing protein